MMNLTASDISKPVKMDWTTVPPKWGFPCARNGGYRIFPASHTILRRRAQNLVNRIYKRCGYVKSNDEEDQSLTTTTIPPAFTLLAEDAKSTTVGTISLNLDGRSGLPSDEIFEQEIAHLRARRQPLAEVTGLAISEDHTHSKTLLIHLLDFIFILARQECPNGIAVLEVNPRHVAFYQKLLHFTVAGPVRLCHRVQDAPARLLYLDLAAQEDAIRKEAGVDNVNRVQRRRSLYSKFYTLKDEVHIKRFLAHDSADVTD